MLDANGGVTDAGSGVRHRLHSGDDHLPRWSMTMINAATFSFRGLAMALALGAGFMTIGDADALSRKDKHTLIGAVVGGVAGSALSNGDARYTVGGALAGGAIGNLATSDRRDDRHGRYDRYDRRGHDRRHDGRRWQHRNRQADWRRDRDRDRRDWNRQHRGGRW